MDVDREWRLVTVPYWKSHPVLGLQDLLGEVPLRTDIPRWIDGVTIKRRGRGGAPPLALYLDGASPADKKQWLEQIPGSTVTVIQTKVERVGMSVLGQTLLSTVVLPQRYVGARATGIVLGTASDEDLARVL